MPLQEKFEIEADRLRTTARIAPMPRPPVIHAEVVFSGDVPARALVSRRSSSQARRVLFPIAALGLALAVSCGVAELGLRACGYGRNYTNPMGSFFEPDNELGCHGKANFVGRFRRAEFDASIEHDEHGFRRSEPASQPVRNDVYVLGDSYVWGYGVGQHDLLTNQMARRLTGLQVHNLGLIGAGTVQEYLIFQKYAVNRLRPGDTVVLAFFNNDFGDNIGLHEKGRIYATINHGEVSLVPPAAPSVLRQWKNWMKDQSCLFNLVTYCADRYRDDRSVPKLGQRATRPMPSPEKIAADTCDASPAVAITRHYLVELRDACRARQVRFLVACVPGQGELGEDDVTSTADLCLPEELAARRAFDRLARELGLETIDLITSMAAAKRSGRFQRLTFAHDFHWNAAGHTVAAEAIAAAIR